MNAGQDFMNDALMCGRLLAPFMGLDDFNREIRAIEVDLSLHGRRASHEFWRYTTPMTYG